MRPPREPERDTGRDKGSINRREPDNDVYDKVQACICCKGRGYERVIDVASLRLPSITFRGLC